MNLSYIPNRTGYYFVVNDIYMDYPTLSKGRDRLANVRLNAPRLITLFGIKRTTPARIVYARQAAGIQSRQSGPE
jgi:hypothetical protein